MAMYMAINLAKMYPEAIAEFIECGIITKKGKLTEPFKDMLPISIKKTNHLVGGLLLTALQFLKQDTIPVIDDISNFNGTAYTNIIVNLYIREHPETLDIIRKERNELEKEYDRNTGKYEHFK